MQLIWFLIVKNEQVTSNGLFAYRLILAIKTTVDQLEALYQKYGSLIYETPGTQAMYFKREPDETPLVEKSLTGV